MEFFWSIITFRGRAARHEWWILNIFYLASLFVLLCLVEAGQAESEELGPLQKFLFFPYFYLLVALDVRRWHDIGKSGWWILICIIPFAGWLISFIANGFLVGTSGENDYGGDPLEDNRPLLQRAKRAN